RGKGKSSPALLRAAQEGNLEKIKDLLAQGKDINSRGRHGLTVLGMAILCRQTRAALLLLKWGADFGRIDADGSGALAFAAMQGELRVARSLLNQGADVNAADRDGVTPLMWAANRGSFRVVKLLLERGADPNRQDWLQYNEGATALMYASPSARNV